MTAIIRPHVALAVTDLDAAVGFYRTLFDCEPSKLRPGYAKFDLANPKLNLSLNQAPEAKGTPMPMHFGVEVADTEAVKAARARIAKAGLPIRLDEENVTCCYAVQDKFWLTDPDGHAWEIFTVLADAEERGTSTVTENEEACCAPTCCK